MFINNKLIYSYKSDKSYDRYFSSRGVQWHRTRSKLRTYGKIKTKIGIEKYLFCVPNIEFRTTLSRIRLSNHELIIEKDRHRNVDIRLKNCPFCPMGILEDEYHFLLHCKTQQPPHYAMNYFWRPKRYFHISNTSPRDKQFELLLSDERIVKVTGTFLCKALKLRRFLMESRKNLI